MSAIVRLMLHTLPSGSGSCVPSIKPLKLTQAKMTTSAAKHARECERSRTPLLESLELILQY